MSPHSLCNVLLHIAKFLKSAYAYNIISVSCIEREALISVYEQVPAGKGYNRELLARYEYGYLCIYDEQGLLLYKENEESVTDG